LSDVAVIIPAYQSESTIDAALESVAGQTSPPAEVVVVDDGSSDHTRERAEQWGSVLPITVLRQANGGPAAARRRGIEASSSPLIALLDADDLWLPDHLEVMRATYDRHGGIISAGAIRWIPGQGAARRDHVAAHPVPPPEEQPVAILRSNFVFVGALFSRRDHDRAGGFRDGFSGAEDWDLWIRMIRDGARVWPVGEPTVVYRINEGSLSAGARIHDTYRAVLERALVEADAADERAEIQRSMPRYVARAELARAHDAVAIGDLGAARAIARGVREAPLPFRLEAFALAVAPRAAQRVGDLIRRRRWRV
jgi:glycosyltransferase involved in cell wall biosynthesis